MTLQAKLKEFPSYVVLASFSINLLPCQVMAMGREKDETSRAGISRAAVTPNSALEAPLLEEGDKGSSDRTSGVPSCLQGLKSLLTRSRVRENIEMDNMVEAPSPQSSWAFPSFVPQIDLPETLLSSPPLQQLLTLESSALRSWLRWKTADHLLQKALYGVVLNPESHLTPDAEKPWWPTKRHWVQGQAMPLDTNSSDYGTG